MLSPTQPTFETERLLLRHLVLEDAPAIQRLAGRREIADTTLSILHPYSEEDARAWINFQAEAFAQGQSVVFAIQLKKPNALIGTVGLKEIDTEHVQAEIGFWIGVESWGNGYATEAVKAVVADPLRRAFVARSS